MKSQRFFTVTLEFENSDVGLGRNVIEEWLRFFFNLPNLTGEELAKQIGHKRLVILKVKEPWEADLVEFWWEESFLVRNIK